MPSRMNRITDAATLLASLGAVVIAGLAITRSGDESSISGTTVDREVDDWSSIVSDGHKLGPLEAPVTIVEFGDYQCPACRGWQPEIEQLLDVFVDQVQFVYRHWPLPYHARAYPAARAAVCAAEQDRFWEYHRGLFASESLADEDFVRLAMSVAVPDLDGFQQCLVAAERVPSIEQDIATAESIGAPGTPTFLINGVILGSSSPASVRARVEEVLRDE